MDIGFARRGRVSGMGMEVQLSLSLPRDRSTVPLTRRVLDAALAVFSVTKDCRHGAGVAMGDAAGPGPDDQAGRGVRIIRARADAVELRRDQRRGAGLRVTKFLARTRPAPA